MRVKRVQRELNIMESKTSYRRKIKDRLKEKKVKYGAVGENLEMTNIQ